MSELLRLISTDPEAVKRSRQYGIRQFVPELLDYIAQNPAKAAIGTGKFFGDFALDMMPNVIGDVKAAQEAITGQNVLTGEQYGKGARLLAAISALPMVPGMTKIAKGLKQAKSFDQSVKEASETISDLAGMKRHEILGIEPQKPEDFMTAHEQLATLRKKNPFVVDLFEGDLNAQREVFEAVKPRLSPQGKTWMNTVDKMRNKMSIHPNTKTVLSMDFSTSCPNRLDPCPYCYVEHSRWAKLLGLGFMHGKKLVETPYRREILSMPPDVVTEMNRLGGLRAHSFGDYRPVADYNNWRLALQDAEAKGLYVKAITKIPEFVRTFGDHPNLRINISVDALPREISNAPTIAEAMALKAGRDNIKIRAVALNEKEALDFVADPRIDVITLYHGLTGDKLKQIVKHQNPKMIDKIGQKRFDDILDSWENMGPNSKKFKKIANAAPNRVCCISGKCSGDPTKCGFGLSAAGGILAGVILPEVIQDSFDSPGGSPVGQRGMMPGLATLNPYPY